MRRCQVAVWRKQFFHDNANQRETWYELARDTNAGHVFVIYQWADRGGDIRVKNFELPRFLNEWDHSKARDALIELIGELVETDAKSNA